MKNKFSIVIAIVFFSFFIWVSFTFYKAYQPQAIILQGEIDAQSYNISSKVAGRVSKIFVSKGDIVEIGDVVFTISSPEVEAKLEQAEAAKEAASAERKKAETGARKQEIQAAYDTWQKAKVAESLMKATYERIERLFKEGVVAEQKKDEVYTKYKAAKYDSSAAKQIFIMTKEGVRVEVKEAASAQEKVYKAKVDEVNAFMKETTQYSFHKGEVSEILIHTGELSPTGFPIVSLIDIDEAWAKFFVREDYLMFFKKGKNFKVKIPALGENNYTFKVSNIAVMGDYATWRATESGKGFDMKSFEVELKPVDFIPDLRVGMSVLLEL